LYGLKELLIEEEKRLQTIKKIVDARLENVPQGTLRIGEVNGRVQYIHCEDKGENKLTYIKKENITLAKQLAQKAYDRKIQKLVDRRLKQLKMLCKEYEESEISDKYEQLHPNRKALISAVETPWEQNLRVWKSIPYTGKEFEPNTPEIYTKKGERVRSKSEKLLADTFYGLGIEYKYECPIKLKGYGVVYPDFTILRKRDRKEIYWEHDGKMDDPKYAEKAIRKINLYIANKIYPGDTLILSYESSGVVLNDRIIAQMIEKYIL